jgi:hypothetical protein
MADKDQVRDAVRETLEVHGLHLAKFGWEEDLVKRTVKISLRISTDLDIQEDLPFGVVGER